MPADAIDEAWSRGTLPGVALGFLGIAGGIWLAALVLWELGRPDLAVVATGLGAAVPVIVLFGGVHARPQLWVLRVRAGETLEPALLEALGERPTSWVEKDSLPRGSPLRHCVRVLKVAKPECLVGWARPDAPPHPATPPRDGVLYLFASPHAGPELDVLKGSLARSLRAVPSRSA